MTMSLSKTVGPLSMEDQIDHPIDDRTGNSAARLCLNYPNKKRQELGIASDGQEFLRLYICNSILNGVSLRQTLKRFQQSNDFSHSSMNACIEFLRVMGRPVNETVREVLEILASQLQVALAQVNSEDGIRLFPSAREAALLLEVPRLRSCAMAILQTCCQNQVPLDAIDDGIYCSNCGGNCGQEQIHDVDQRREVEQERREEAPNRPISHFHHRPYSDYNEYSIQPPVRSCISARSSRCAVTIESQLVPNFYSSSLFPDSSKAPRSNTSDSDRRLFFVSSICSKTLLKNSIISSPQPSPLIGESSSITSIDDNILPYSNQQYHRGGPHHSPAHPYEDAPSCCHRVNEILMLAHFEKPGRRPSDSCWDDCSISSSRTSDELFQNGRRGIHDYIEDSHFFDSSRNPFDTPQSLMRMIICRCRTHKDLHTFCRHESPLSFGKYLWPYSPDWLLSDIISLVQLFSLRLRAAIISPRATSATGFPISTRSQHSANSGNLSDLVYRSSCISNEPAASLTNNEGVDTSFQSPHPPFRSEQLSEHDTISPTSQFVSNTEVAESEHINSFTDFTLEATKLISLISSSSLSYRLTTAVLERLTLLSAMPLLSSAPCLSLPPYSAFDPASPTHSNYHNILIRFFAEMGAVAHWDNCPHACNNSFQKLHQGVKMFEKAPLADATKSQSSSIENVVKLSHPIALCPIPDYHLASIRVHLLLRLERENPSLPQQLDPIAWSIIAPMESLLLAVSHKRKAHPVHHLSTPSLSSPRIGAVAQDYTSTIDQCISAIRSLVVHSLHDFLTVSFILMHPPFLLLLSEQSQIFESETDRIASSSPKVTETLLGLMILPLSFPILHLNAKRLIEAHSAVAPPSSGPLAVSFEQTMDEATHLQHPGQSLSRHTLPCRGKRNRESEASAEGKAMEQKRGATIADKRPSKRRRKSFSAAFDFDDGFSELFPPKSSLAAVESESVCKDRSAVSSVTIGAIIHVMRLSDFLPQPSTSVSSHSSATLLRDIRECIPRFRLATYRFIRCLNRALGFPSKKTQDSYPHVSVLPSLSSTVRRDELEEREHLFGKMENFFKMVACCSLPRGKVEGSAASDVEVPLLGGSDLSGSDATPLEENRSVCSHSRTRVSTSPRSSMDYQDSPSLSTKGPSSVTTKSKVDIDRHPSSTATTTKFHQLDKRFLKLILSGILRCGLCLPHHDDLVDFVLRASSFLDGQALLLQDFARLLCDPRLPTSTNKNISRYIRRIMRRIALPPSEQQLFTETFEIWKSSQTSNGPVSGVAAGLQDNLVSKNGVPASNSTPLPGLSLRVPDQYTIPSPDSQCAALDLLAIEQFLTKRVLRLCHVKCLIKKASQLGLTVVDAHDREYFKLARRFIETKIKQLWEPPSSTQSFKTNQCSIVQWQLEFWQGILGEMSTNDHHYQYGVEGARAGKLDFSVTNS